MVYPLIPGQTRAQCPGGQHPLDGLLIRKELPQDCSNHPLRGGGDKDIIRFVVPDGAECAEIRTSLYVSVICPEERVRAIRSRTPWLEGFCAHASYDGAKIETCLLVSNGRRRIVNERINSLTLKNVRWGGRVIVGPQSVVHGVKKL